MRPKLRCHHKSKAELPQKSKAEAPDRRCFETSRRRPKARAERADCCAHTTADKHFCNMCVLCFAFVCNVFLPVLCTLGCCILLLFSLQEFPILLCIFVFLAFLRFPGLSDHHHWVGGGGPPPLPPPPARKQDAMPSLRVCDYLRVSVRVCVCVPFGGRCVYACWCLWWWSW